MLAAYGVGGRGDRRWLADSKFPGCAIFWRGRPRLYVPGSATSIKCRLYMLLCPLLWISGGFAYMLTPTLLAFVRVNYVTSGWGRQPVFWWQNSTKKRFTAHTVTAKYARRMVSFVFLTSCSVWRPIQANWMITGHGLGRIKPLWDRLLDVMCLSRMYPRYPFERNIEQSVCSAVPNTYAEQILWILSGKWSHQVDFLAGWAVWVPKLVHASERWFAIRQNSINFDVQEWWWALLFTIACELQEGMEVVQ